MAPEDVFSRTLYHQKWSCPGPTAGSGTHRGFTSRPHFTGSLPRQEVGGSRQACSPGLQGTDFGAETPVALPTLLGSCGIWDLPQLLSAALTDSCLTRNPVWVSQKTGAKTFYLITTSPFQEDPTTLPTLWRRSWGHRAPVGGDSEAAVLRLNLAFSVRVNVIIFHRP